MQHITAMKIPYKYEPTSADEFGTFDAGDDAASSRSRTRNTAQDRQRQETESKV